MYRESHQQVKEEKIISIEGLHKRLRAKYLKEITKDGLSVYMIHVVISRK